MSPELELLDQLLTGDEPLFLVLTIFGWPENWRALERARISIIHQFHDGLIEIKHVTNGCKRVLVEWEVWQVLNDERNWLKQKHEAEYCVSLTEKGSKSIG